MADASFQESTFLLLDRMERDVAALKEALRSADEYLLYAQQRVQEVVQENGPGVPGIQIVNQMPQSIGLSATWVNEQFVVTVTHRGAEFDQLLGPSGTAHLEIGQPA
jgi:hypothetical protein